MELKEDEYSKILDLELDEDIDETWTDSFAAGDRKGDKYSDDNLVIKREGCLRNFGLFHLLKC